MDTENNKNKIIIGPKITRLTKYAQFTDNNIYEELASAYEQTPTSTTGNWIGDSVLFKSLSFHVMKFYVENVTRVTSTNSWYPMFAKRKLSTTASLSSKLVMLGYKAFALDKTMYMDLIQVLADILEISTTCARGTNLIKTVRNVDKDRTQWEISTTRGTNSIKTVRNVDKDRTQWAYIQSVLDMFAGGKITSCDSSHYVISGFLEFTRSSMAKSVSSVSLMTTVEDETAEEEDDDHRAIKKNIYKQIAQDVARDEQQVSQTIDDDTTTIYFQDMSENRGGSDSEVIERLFDVLNKSTRQRVRTKPTLMLKVFNDVICRLDVHESNVWSEAPEKEWHKARLLNAKHDWRSNSGFVWMWFHLAAAKFNLTNDIAGMTALVKLFGSMDAVLVCNVCRSHFANTYKERVRNIKDPVNQFERLLIMIHRNITMVDDNIHHDHVNFQDITVDDIVHEYRSFWRTFSYICKMPKVNTTTTTTTSKPVQKATNK